MSSQQTAVLLMAYGAAAGLEDIPAYLEDIRGGRPASPELVEEIRKRYRLMGGKSPLLDITRAQAAALERRLNGDGKGGRREYKVYFGMRHSAPTIGAAVAEIERAGHLAVVAMALTPYYSKLSVEAYLTRYREAVEAADCSFATVVVNSWSCQPRYLEAWAAKVREGLARFPDAQRRDARVLFTAHSLPARILNDGDPYPTELRRAVEEVARLCGLSSWEFAYQSRGRTPEPWLGPDAAEVIDRLAAEGARTLLLVPIGFISDHMETLYDDDVLYRRQAAARGLRFERAASLNDDPLLIEAIADVVLKRVATVGG